MALLTWKFIVKYIRKYSDTTHFLNDSQAYRAANVAGDGENTRGQPTGNVYCESEEKGRNNNLGNLEKTIFSAKSMQFNVKTNEGGGNFCNGIGICPIASRLRI
jgi:hemerythrin-like domain-containing protein